ncbi:glycoside hydrolase family 97 catalytic domain-containing protein [Mycetocola saprophilus]|uniref:glycoside hydrolase family 97 catalytic domain-containing protein n=1 Tax=Mycetocola saprophilus TaxID=76636 RepID=UPI003BF3ABF1
MKQHRLVALASGALLLAGAAIPLGSLPAAAVGGAYTVTSPDGNTSLVVTEATGGALNYSVAQNGQSVIDSSALGLVTAAADLSTGLNFDSVTTRAVHQEYSLVARTNGPITSDANEMTLTYRKGAATLEITARAQNDGVAFRYRVAGVGQTTLTREATKFALPAGTGLWASPYREAKDYEDSYPYVSSTQMGTKKFSMPVLASLRDNASWALITEAAVYNNDFYPAIRLDANGNNNRTLNAQLPGPDNNVFNTAASAVAVPVNGAVQTPWRVVIASSQLEKVTVSSMVTDLNPDPAAGTDSSWVEPGAALWSWWSNEEKAGEGDNMRLSQQSYIDSAEELGVRYVTVDCCYNNTNGDVEYLAAYGKERGVGIFIWMHKGDFTNADGSYFTQAQVNQVMQNVKNRGVSGVKIDFMQSDRAETIALYDRISKAAGTAHVLVNFHGSTKPAGENRTYPQIITSEAVLGNEQYKYGRPPTAKDSATYPFTRNVIGGMDMTPITFSIGSLLTTHAHQLALGVVTASAMAHYADSNAAYETWVGRHLLRAIPSVWDQTKLIEGFPGDYATLARRSGDDWFIGSVTDKARTATIPLSFLGSGSYTATIFADGADDRSIALSTQTVTAGTTLSIPLRLHGGVSVHVSKTPLAMLGTADRVIEAEGSAAVRAGGAQIAACPGCSGGNKVGSMGGSATLSFPNLQVATAGTYTLRVGYLSEDPRSFTVKVNAGSAQTVSPPRSGKGNDGKPSGWEIVRTVDVPVQLNAGNNTVVIGAVGGYAPDFDRVTVVSGYALSSGSASVNALNAGSTTAQIRYSAASAISAKVVVNGTVVPITLPATGGAGHVGTQTVYLPLGVGANAVSVQRADGGAIAGLERLDVRQ